MVIKHACTAAIAAAALALPTVCLGAEAPDTAKSTPAFSYVPEIHGTVRAKYEYATESGKGRFEVRNARLSVEGKVIPIVSYKLEADFCDEGAIKMLDAWARVEPVNGLRITAGQMRVPFTIDAHRAPHAQYFANRSFIAKQAGNIRDVGAMAGWTFGRKSWPVTLEAGLFNGSGLTKQKDYWTSDYNFSVKAQTTVEKQFNVTLSVQKARYTETNAYMYDAGAWWDNGRFHIEAEYLRKHYQSEAFRPVNAVDAFATYRLPLKRTLSAITFGGRYDYLSDHSKGTKGDEGMLFTDDPERHRMTLGTTLSLGRSRLQADLRINYEHYFYGHGVEPRTSEESKFVAEVVCRF